MRIPMPQVSARLVSLVLFVLPASRGVRAAEPPLAERFMLGDGIGVGMEVLADRLDHAPDDDQARYGLGVLQVLHAIERLGQSLHRHGGLAADEEDPIVPFLRLPVPASRAPVETSYADVRGMVATFIADLAVAERTLDGIRDDGVSLPLRFGLVRLDLDGDGQAAESEALWRLYGTLVGLPGAARGRGPERDASADDVLRCIAEGLIVRLDRGDAYWLQGYCHLLSALGEYALAYDMERTFDILAPRLFARPRCRHLPEAMVLRQPARQDGAFDSSAFVDRIAALHEMRWPVIEPRRTAAALGHLEEVIRLSRASWRAIESETDDSGEWIPNARQHGVIPEADATAEMIAGWREFLDEAEAILAGRRLVPHWRLAPGWGINLRRVFLEPRSLDVVLWVHGSGAGPFIEEGECTAPETWRRLEQVFDGRLVMYGIWFN